jgi:hypothetical protein
MEYGDGTKIVYTCIYLMMRWGTDPRFINDVLPLTLSLSPWRRGELR